MPPHHGHRLVIQTALAQSDRVMIVVTHQEDDVIAIKQRVDWLQQLYQAASVRVLEVNFPVTDELHWASGVLAAVGETPAVVFSSERYGQRLAELLTCAHVMVDKERQQVSISASQILQDPEQYRDFFDPMIFDYLQTTTTRRR